MEVQKCKVLAALSEQMIKRMTGAKLSVFLNEKRGFLSKIRIEKHPE
jgi:hypothetical protein